MSAQQKRLLWPALVVVAAVSTALLLVSARTKATSNSSYATPSAPTAATKSGTASPSQNDSAKDRLEGEIVSAQPNGFEPNQITRPAGEFLLMVDNRTGLDQLQVRLERVVGKERLDDIGLTKRAYSWNTVLKLPPGEYILTEASHPEWVCRITLTPH